MGGGRLFTAVGLLRQARPGGFCPACRVLMNARGASQELAKPMVAALVVLAVAGVAWAAMVQESRSMAGMDGMDLGLGPIEAFASELCALHGPLPFNLMRSAAVAGTRYGLSCLGCSAALMVAIVLLGMASLWWAVLLGSVVLVYKFAPPLRMRNELLLSAALVALGVAYVMMA